MNHRTKGSKPGQEIFCFVSYVVLWTFAFCHKDTLTFNSFDQIGCSLGNILKTYNSTWPVAPQNSFSGLRKQKRIAHGNSLQKNNKINLPIKTEEMNIITASSSNLPTSHVPQHSHWEEVDGEGWEEGQYSPKSTTSCSVRKPRDICDLIHLPTQTYLLKANHAWDEVPFKKKVPLAKKKPVFSDLGQGSDKQMLVQTTVSTSQK